MRTRQKEIQKNFISFEDVTLRIRERHILNGTNWRIEKGRNWAVLGPNGSGKSTLVRAIMGKTPVVGGHIERHDRLAQPDAIGYVSFELHQHIISREQALDEARHFSGQLNSHLRVRQILALNEENPINHDLSMERMWSIFHMHELLERPIRKLSTGEMRKVLILKAVRQSKNLLILDEPFEGLDGKSATQLRSCLNTLVESGLQLLLVTHRLENIIPAISHVICLKGCRVFDQGHRSQILVKENLKRLFDRRNAVKVPDKKQPVPIPVKGLGKGATVIKVKDACVRYDELSVFAHLNWTVRKGENWAVIGPNGSGKTTLLHLISADHPQAYANEIYLFGRRRGSGESIWEIKNRMGVVSTEFQVNYRKSVNVLEVVLSGFFNSIGLYRRASSEQRNIAREWIERLSLSHLVDKRFDHLSYGERRRILIARALVTSPEILVLDEPCQGLDPMNRQGVLDLIDDICNKTATQLLYVTHHLSEMPNCITHILDLETKNTILKGMGTSYI